LERHAQQTLGVQKHEVTAAWVGHAVVTGCVGGDWLLLWCCAPYPQTLCGRCTWCAAPALHLNGRACHRQCTPFEGPASLTSVQQVAMTSCQDCCCVADDLAMLSGDNGSPAAQLVTDAWIPWSGSYACHCLHKILLQPHSPISEDVAFMKRPPGKLTGFVLSSKLACPVASLCAWASFIFLNSVSQSLHSRDSAMTAVRLPNLWCRAWFFVVMSWFAGMGVDQ
jgi:hypothetical protein